MTDGSRLRESWSSALKHAQNNFRSLLTSSASASWKRVTAVARETTTNSPPGKGKGKALPQASDVIVHRRPTKSGDVVRLVLELPAEDGLASLESWRAVLTTPEMRKEWDPTVEAAHVVEMFDPNTRISKTDFTLGWPANPRDAITISRAYTDANTLIDISTSLPRSTDEPGYLRPAPPYYSPGVSSLSPALPNHQESQTCPNYGSPAFGNKISKPCGVPLH
ncbi:hypothetical protein FRC02_001156 [Tulasnella sp. 418]|nr:hypothetical protein FRC02_001156 [Tulasnella sp. 418]